MRADMKILKKILKWFGISVGAIGLLLGGTYLYLSIDAPPAYVTPGKDLLATGTPSLPLPEGDEKETFEPHIAIDPNDPDHLVTAAMMGDRFGRGGRNLHRWTSRDGGKTWQGHKVKALAFQDNFAADTVIAFDDKSRDHMLAMFGDRPFPKDPVILHMMLQFSQLVGKLLGRPLSPEEEEPRGGGVAMSIGDPVTGKLGAPFRVTPVPERNADKTWLAIDNSPASPYRGNVYSVWSESSTLTKLDIAMTTTKAGTAVGTINVPVVDQESSSYWPSISTRPNGRVDLVWFDETKQIVQHRYSDDGGKSFSKIANITAERKGVRVDSPAITTAPDGTVMTCWVESTEKLAVRTKCATTRNDEDWSAAVDIDTAISPKGMIGQPAVAASATGLWVLAYKTDKQTDVVLYRSVDGGKSFSPYQVLASRSFGVEKVCIGLAHDTPCRYQPAVGRFSGGGDYIGLSAVGNRVAAVFGLTLGNDPVQFATNYVKVIDVPTTVDSTRQK